MVAGQALVHTGALEPVARRLSRFWKRAPVLALLATLVVGAVLSAFMNNTPIVVLMLPMLIGAAARSQTPTSGVLLPMGFATLVGGMGTTIGTSTNLLVVSVAADMGMQRFQMFDFALPVVIAGGIGLLYLWLISSRNFFVKSGRNFMSGASCVIKTTILCRYLMCVSVPETSCW